MVQDRIPSQQCPACGAPADAHTPAQGRSNAKPGPGDLTICISCGNPLRFTDSKPMKLRRLTQGEYADLEPGIRTELLMARQRIENLKNL